MKIIDFYDENNDNIGEPLELSYQSILLNGNEEFYAKSFYTDANNSQKFTWYFSDVNATRSIEYYFNFRFKWRYDHASEMLIGINIMKYVIIYLHKQLILNRVMFMKDQKVKECC